MRGAATQKKARSVKRTECILNSLDIFKTPFQFNLPNGYNSLPTVAGTLVTVFLVTILFAYATLKLIDVYQYDDSLIMNNEIDSYYE